ncbi:MAG: hypothetical protein IPQ24_10050 [Anaeromyxobacter sp.]|nr:hypothetical protein [Anaeromyxobacter sp.]
MKILSRLCVLAAVLFASPALAGFGMPSMPSVGGGGATGADVDKFMTSSADANLLVQNAAGQLAKAVVAKDKLDKITELFKAAQAIQDPKEKEAALNNARATLTAEAAAVDYEKLAKGEASQWDEAKKKSVKDSLMNLGLGLLKDTEVLASGKKLVSGVPSPDVASRLPLVKDTLAALGGQVDGLGKLLGGAKSLMTVVKLDKLPGSSSEPAAPVGSFP